MILGSLVVVEKNIACQQARKRGAGDIHEQLKT